MSQHEHDMMGVSILVMIYGWGIQPVSWWWIVGGGIVVRVLIATIEAAGKISKKGDQQCQN